MTETSPAKFESHPEQLCRLCEAEMHSRRQIEVDLAIRYQFKAPEIDAMDVAELLGYCSPACQQHAAEHIRAEWLSDGDERRAKDSSLGQAVPPEAT